MGVVRKALPMLPMAPPARDTPAPPPGQGETAPAGHAHRHAGHGPAGVSAAPDPSGAEAQLPEEIMQLREWVGTALERVENLPDDEARALVFDLLQGVDALHRETLGRLLALVQELGGGGLRQRVERDPVVRSLLELYDLIPVDEREQVTAALAEVHPYVESHGGSLEVLGVDEGRVRVRLSGSCESCPGSSVTLRRMVETALREQVPSFRELIVEESPPPVERTAGTGRRPLRRPRWVTVSRLDDLADGEMRAAYPEGVGLLLVRLSGEVYAYANGCPPGSPLTLHLGRLEGTELVCPWHGCRYDARTGRRRDADGRLTVYPVAVQGGEVRIALGTQEVQPG